MSRRLIVAVDEALATPRLNNFEVGRALNNDPEAMRMLIEELTRLPLSYLPRTTGIHEAFDQEWEDIFCKLIVYVCGALSPYLRNPTTNRVDSRLELTRRRYRTIVAFRNCRDEFYTLGRLRFQSLEFGIRFYVLSLRSFNRAAIKAASFESPVQAEFYLDNVCRVFNEQETGRARMNGMANLHWFDGL
jgi:hypothetical protein